jgi:hypothetical protein
LAGGARLARVFAIGPMHRRGARIP